MPGAARGGILKIAQCSLGTRHITFIFHILYERYVFCQRFTSPLVFMFLFLRWVGFGLYNEIMNYYDGLPEMCTDTRKLIAAEYSSYKSSNFMSSCHATYKAINLRNNIHLNRIDLNP